MRIKKKLLSVLLSLGFVVLIGQSLAFTTQTKWANLKVLPQDISKDSLFYLMEGYNIALGVNCNHCHAPNKKTPSKLDFSSDEKIEKEIARGMIKMTAAINQDYFQPHFPDPKPTQVFVINCVMCHRGTSNPEKFLSQMGSMYKTYDPNRDNRKEEIIKGMEEMKKKKK